MTPSYAASSGESAARAGDLGGDGFGDLAIGSAEGTIGGVAKAGYVSVLYGTGQFAAAHVNGDGYTDLATVAYFADAADEGTLGLLAGSARGLSTRTLGKTGLPLAGYRVVAGDITGDGKDDLVIGTTAADGPDDFLFRMFPGTASGRGEGVAYGGPVQPGTAAALADSAGDGPADLVTSDITVPDADGINGAGTVTVVPGAKAGLDAARAHTITLATPGVMGASEGDDLFGTSVAAGDYDADGTAGLTIGAPGKYLRTGAVSVIPGSPKGPTGTGSVLSTPASLRHPAVGAAFGSAPVVTTRP